MLIAATIVEILINLEARLICISSRSKYKINSTRVSRILRLGVLVRPRTLAGYRLHKAINHAGNSSTARHRRLASLRTSTWVSTIPLLRAVCSGACFNNSPDIYLRAPFPRVVLLRGVYYFTVMPNHADSCTNERP